MSLLHQSIGLIYVVAFISLYIQYHGLYGPNGIQPISNFLSWVLAHHLPPDQFLFYEKFYHIPSLLIYSHDLHIKADIFGEFLILIGIISSSCIALGSNHTILFISSWLCYLSLFILGQAFLMFQWDMLLLEVGFLSIFSSIWMVDGQILKPVNWCYRFLVWKLMFMAGVVKLQSKCPTWFELTALEYHFATQGLPTVIGWYFHQFHPFFLRVGVIFALLVEIPLTFLLLSPMRFSRRFGAVAQALLQIFIMLTGNYNFFNLLTIFLLIPVWYDDFPLDLSSKDKPDQLLATTSYKFTGIHWVIQLLCITALTIYSSSIMFHFSILPNDSSHHQILDRINLQVNPSFYIDTFTTPGCLFSYGVCILFCLFYSILALHHYISQFMTQSSFFNRISLTVRFLLLIVSIVFTVIYIQFSAIPLDGIQVDMKPYVFPQVATYSKVREISSMSLFSGYGLFRTMAGVGQLSETEIKQTFRIGGKLPSVVARHEIVLEGYDVETEQWVVIPFKYLPSYTTLTPKWIFPHQPRLDWHMGFAAHSSYQHHPWFIALIYRLLQGQQSSVIALLDQERYPFQKNPPLLIRSLLYEYDLTRLDTYWNRNIPSSEILMNESIWSPILHASTSTPTMNWWQRKKLLGEYMIPLHIDNPSLKLFLEANGYHFHHYLSLEEEKQQCSTTTTTATTTTSPGPNLSEYICWIVFNGRIYLTEENLWKGYYTILILIILQWTIGKWKR